MLNLIILDFCLHSHPTLAEDAGMKGLTRIYCDTELKGKVVVGEAIKEASGFRLIRHSNSHISIDRLEPSPIVSR